MTATRMTRSGRSRFLIGLGLIILMFGFVAIFHSSQTQLDESRQQLIRCEQQQEALNARMQAIIEHKFRLERSLEAERKEHLETRQSFEQRVKEQNEQHTKAKMTSNLHYDNLNQRYKLLQKEHVDLVEDCSKAKKSHLEVVNSLDTKVKSLQSQLQQVRNLNDKDLDELKTKYDTVVQEKERLEILLKTTSLSAENHKKKITTLTDTIMEYKNNCEYKPKTDREIISSYQILPSPMTGNHHQLMSNHPLDKPLVQKSFNEQQLIIPKPLASSEDKIRTAAENVQQVPPLNSTAKSSTTAASGGVAAIGAGEDGGTHDGNRHALSVANQASTPTANKAKRSSTAKELLNIPHKPPKHIPLGVAPIPDNFQELLDNNNHNDDQVAGSKLANIQQGEADNKQDTDNNRYVNVVDDLVGKNNEGGEQDTGAHEVKDADFNADKNDDNLNNGAEEDNNFFEAKIAPKDNEDRGDGDDIEVFGMGGHKHYHKDGDDDLAPVANALLDADNLNNEVAGDQGKEQFADGLHIDEGNEEEEDEDDYSNPAARQQEGPAIRN